MNIMKKLLSVLLTLVLCMSLATTALAADSFVPSIGEKPAPDIEGDVELLEGDKVIDKIPEDHMVITPVSLASASDQIPDAAAAELLDVYSKLKDGSMTIPYEKVDAAIDPAAWEIRDLFDVSLICQPDSCHREPLAREGVYIRVTFDVGVKADDQVVIMFYKDGQWIPAESVVNNGDGTVTAVMEDVCPVAICVKDKTPTPQTGDANANNLTIWIAMLCVSLVALVALFVIYRKKSASK